MRFAPAPGYRLGAPPALRPAWLPKTSGLELSTLDFGLSTLDFGPWTLDFGLSTLDFESIHVHSLLNHFSFIHNRPNQTRRLAHNSTRSAPPPRAAIAPSSDSTQTSMRACMVALFLQLN